MHHNKICSLILTVITLHIKKQYSSINFHGGLIEGISLILITNVHDFYMRAELVYRDYSMENVLYDFYSRVF